MTDPSSTLIRLTFPSLDNSEAPAAACCLSDACCSGSPKALPYVVRIFGFLNKYTKDSLLLTSCEIFLCSSRRGHVGGLCRGPRSRRVRKMVAADARREKDRSRLWRKTGPARKEVRREVTLEILFFAQALACTIAGEPRSREQKSHLAVAVYSSQRVYAKV